MEGVVNYKTGKCIDSKYRIHKSWNWISHWSNNSLNMLSDCNSSENDQKFTIQPTDIENEVLLRVSNGTKDQCITTKSGTEGALEGDCNRNDPRYIYRYNPNNKSLQNKGDNTCLTVINDSTGPRLSHAACSSNNDLQAFISGFDTVKRCREMGIDITKCDSSKTSVIPKVCSALNTSPCTLSSIAAKDPTILQTCLDKTAENCLDEICKKPSYYGTAVCQAHCVTNSPSCLRAKECVDLGINDANCNQTFIDTRRQCRDLGINDEECTKEQAEAIVSDCVRLGIRNVLGNNDRQCNATSINETLRECKAYDISDNVCSLNEIREAKTVELQKEAIRNAVSSQKGSQVFITDNSNKFLLLVLLVLSVLSISLSVGLASLNVKI